ncbi:MAG: hypothetical protein ACD_79C00988G0015 [uncultured bacterium]|nr:MAG: hypothetical protein ACD_79C00988G0015 [uncultured bacterium]
MSYYDCKKLLNEHWKQNKPQMYVEMKRNGTLEESMERNACLMNERFEKLVSTGLYPAEAMEFITEDFLKY